MRTVSKFPARIAAIGALASIVASLSGCGAIGTDHIEVGAIPDDYRTRHPIMIGENRKQLPIPVGEAPREMTFAEKAVVAGFLHGYADAGSGPIFIAIPAGSSNTAAAAYAAGQIATIASAEGQGAKVVRTSYAPQQGQPNPPVLVAYNAITASAGPCGKWPEDVLANAENKQYQNFGCAYQNNLAAQVANPMDLLGPRKAGPIDAANRDGIIGDYRDNAGGFVPNIQY